MGQLKEGKTPKMELLDDCASVVNGCFGCITGIIILFILLIIIGSFL